MSPPANPVLVTLSRGDFDETRHRGSLVILKNSTIIVERGSIGSRVFPRSLIKPIVAVALVASCGTGHWMPSPEEIALASSSHFGEAMHLSVLTRWATRLGVNPKDVQCSSHKPFRRSSELSINPNAPFSNLQNNNSGKHLAALTIARALGLPSHNYLDFEHPVQVIFRIFIELFAAVSLHPSGIAIDGCGMPTEPIPILNLALAYERLRTREGLNSSQGQAAERVTKSMRTYPHLVSASGKLSTRISELTRGTVLVKAGAEGGYAAIDFPNRQTTILKVDDGAQRASEAVLIEALGQTGSLSKANYDILNSEFPRQLRSMDETTVTGSIAVHI